MTTYKPLAGNVALITGASRGIGQATAERLAGLGALVALNYRSDDARAQAALDSVAAAGGADARLFKADIGRPDTARQLVDDVLAAYGRIDILVNNAGVQRAALLHKMSDADWHDVLDVNLNAVFYLCRAVLPGMLAARSGRIVNVASASGFLAQKGAASYVASKHGLIGLTKALALETADKGVLVNAVAPGATETDMLAGLTDAQRENLLSLIPLRRAASAAEVAALVAWVVAEAHYSTGNVFHVSGGAVMG